MLRKGDSSQDFLQQTIGLGVVKKMGLVWGGGDMTAVENELEGRKIRRATGKRRNSP